MNFLRYPHLEKYGNEEVRGIHLGTCLVFPKLDGTNASVWCEEGELRFGSRNRLLSLENDNAGFMNLNKDNENLKEFFQEYPDLRLYGEWLVPHTIKGYRESAWKKFYVFDVMNEEGQFHNYFDYAPVLAEYGIDFIPCIKIIHNGDMEQFKREALNCKYLLQDDGMIGEGVVIKNYGFVNQFGKTVWAKMVNQEFKEDHYVAMGAPVKENKINEDVIVDYAVTKALVDKVYAKIVNDEGGWSSKYIPRLLETIFHDVVNEELYNSLKKINFGSVNFKDLKHLVYQRVKKLLPEVF